MSRPRPSRIPAGYLELVLLGVLWGSIGVIVDRIRLSSPGIALVRTSIGFALSLAFVLVRGRARELRLRDRRWLLVLDGLLLAGHWTLMFEAFKRLSVGTAILLVFTGPVFVALAAWPILRERVEIRTVAALGLSLGGMALIAIPAWEVQDPLGVLFALLSAIGFAAMIFAGKYLTRSYAAPVILVWQLGIAAAAVAPLAVAAGFDGLGAAFPWLLLLGALHTTVAGLVYFAALAVVKAQHVGVLTYLEPATAILYAWALLGEVPSASMLMGGLLIVAGGLLIVFKRRPVSGSPEAPVAPQPPALHN